MVVIDVVILPKKICDELLQETATVTPVWYVANYLMNV